MPLSKEQESILKMYQKQPFLTLPGSYTCECCQGEYSGGRHFLRSKELEPICPNCWPDVLSKLESVMEATHATE